MKLDVAGRARREIERIDAWWRANRDHQDVFKEELAEAAEFLANTPELAAVYVVSGRRKVRWLLLPKTEVKLYFFWVDQKREIVHVVSAWGAAAAAARSCKLRPLAASGRRLNSGTRPACSTFSVAWPR